MNEHVTPLAKLGRAVKRAAEQRHFRLAIFGIVPDLEGDDAPHAQMMFVVDQEKLGEEPDLTVIEAALSQPDPKAQEALADEARQKLTDLAKRLKDPNKGILDD